MAEHRRKKAPQLRRRNKDREIQEERIGFREEDYDPETPVFEVSDKDFFGTDEEVALLSPMDGSGSSVERKHSSLLRRSASKRGARAGAARLRGLGLARAKAAIRKRKSSKREI